MTKGFPSLERNGAGVRVKRAMCHIGTRCFLLAALAWLPAIHAPAAEAQTAAGIEQTFAGSLTNMPTENLGVSGAFYVPVYSSVSMSQGKLRADFSVTLSIHNASETRPLVLRRIAYFDTGGKMVEDHLKAPVALRQLRGGLGCHRRDRRTGGRGADGRRRRQRSLRLRHPGPSGQGGRQELTRTSLQGGRR
jgi:hypothetical protein